MRIKHCFPATLETIVFFDLFDRPVHADELQGTINHPAVVHKDELYFLKGRENSVFKQNALQADLWRRVDRFRWLFAAVPFVRMVGVCNSLALGTASSESDIDLFVIADHRHLFTARFFLTAALQLFGVRRHGKKIARRFCLSFFITDDALDVRSMALSPTDPYLEYWFYSMTPVTGFSLWHKFCRANGFAPGVVVQKTFRFWGVVQWLKELPWRTLLGTLLERFLARWQLKRATKNQMHTAHSSIILSPKMLKFHENDRRKIIRAQFIKNMLKI